MADSADYDHGYKDGQDAMRPLFQKAAERIQELTTMSHDEDPHCICSECELYRTLEKEGKAP